jgi:hypothetical protein
MSRRRRRIVRTVIAGLGVAVALGSNAPAQAYPSLPPLGARDRTPVAQDLRSPDARDAASAAADTSRQVAKWMAYDRAVSSLTPAEQTVALGGGPPTAPAAGHATAPAGTSHATGTDWTRVAIISGGVLAAMLLVFGGMFLVTRHPAARTRVVSS